MTNKMRRVLSCFYFLLIAAISIAQSDADKQQAYDFGNEAINLMDNGEIEKSIALLEKSCELDPNNFIYPYEIGYAYYLQQNYKKTIDYLKSVIKFKDINDRCYQLLGNAYDMNNQPEKAIATYERGLKVFPNSGRLYLELGNMHRNDVDKGLSYYEKGIDVDPEFSSNYYWASKIFSNSTEKVWTMIYGELFMNLERGSKRTEEISRLLFNTYFNQIRITSDTSISIRFCENVTFPVTPNPNVKLPFCFVYEPILAIASIEDTITLETLNRIRKRFIDIYFEKQFNNSNPNILFNWHKYILDKDIFECYNYWLLMKGATNEFDSWYDENSEKFDAFIDWFSDNPMQINENFRFSRFAN